MINDKFDYFIGGILGRFNRVMRMLFPNWNQKKLDTLASDPRQQVFMWAQNRARVITGHTTAGQDYINGLLHKSHSWAVEHQWVVNCVDLEEYPLSTTLYIMYKRGVLTEGQYRYHRGMCLEEDVAWMDGLTTHIPPSAPNYLESLDSTLALRNEMLNFC